LGREGAKATFGCSSNANVLNKLIKQV
jgi:hypothetical protein